MKDTIVINYTGRKGGGALDAFEITRALINTGCSVIAILSNDIENLEMWKDIGLEKKIVIDTYSNVISFVINSILFPLRQRNIIIEELKNYNVVAVYSPMITFWTKRINSIFKDALKIVVNHDPIAHSGASKLVIWLMERAYKKADIIVVHSRKFIEIATKKYKNVKYLPLGEHNLYRHTKYKTKIIEYDTQKINFFFFGRITEYKGLDVLAKAYRIISNKYEDSVSLSIIGNGSFDSYKASYDGIRNFKLINRWIKDEEVESVFSGNNLVCVCPYKDATQSGVILVSYDYGIPVIASRTGGIEEQVEHRKTGLLIEPGSVEELVNAMSQFVENKNLNKQMQESIIEYMENVSWDKTAKELLEIIHNMYGEINKK